MSKKEEEDRKAVETAVKEEPAPKVAEPVAQAPPEKKEEKPVVVEEPQAAPIETPSLPPEQLTEIIGKPAMSQAELKKLAELKRLKREGNLKKKEAKD